MSAAPKVSSLQPAVDDATLVVRSRSGDRWADEALYRRHVHSVMNLVVRLLGTRHDAEDIVQDTFASALAGLDRLRDPAAFRPWVLSIAIRQVRGRFRKMRLMRALGLWPTRDEMPLDALARPGVDPESAAELAKIHAALQQLPLRLRVAWTLRHVEGYELAEAAIACECSLATIKRRIAAADDHVRIHVRFRQGGDDV